MFEWYAGVAGIMHLRVIVLNISGPYPQTFVGTCFLAKRIQIRFCPGVQIFGFASFFGLFIKFSISVPWHAWLAG